MKMLFINWHLKIDTLRKISTQSVKRSRKDSPVLNSLENSLLWGPLSLAALGE